MISESTDGGFLESGGVRKSSPLARRTRGRESKLKRGSYRAERGFLRGKINAAVTTAMIYPGNSFVDVEKLAVSITHGPGDQWPYWPICGEDLVISWESIINFEAMTWPCCTPWEP